ncbi:MAG TPA: hypothetical protein PLR07_09865 [Promineifilum sp.]|nr:hypothetical protein [Promineifilum sp.]
MNASVMTLSRSSGTGSEKSHSMGLGEFIKLPAIYRRKASVAVETKLILEDSRSSLTETSHDLRYPLLLPRNVKFGNIRLVQQLPVLLELDDDGTYILSDDLFDRYGTGESPQSAYTNLMEDLSAYYDIIAETATEDYPAAQALFERLQKYIQPVK